MSPLRSLLLLLPLCLLGACSNFNAQDPLRVELVGLQPLPAQPLEARFELSVRVQNPNAQAVTFDGVALELELNDQPLLSGVSDQYGVIPRFGEVLLRVPVSLGAVAMARQLWSTARPSSEQGVTYHLRAKLGGGWRGRRVSDAGVLRWPAATQAPVHPAPQR